MITLLIVSIAMAASAPLISRQMKNNMVRNLAPAAAAEMPTGAVVAFDLETCPPGWVALTSVYGDSGGTFIRNVGGNAESRGVVQLDGVPNIKGEFPADDAYGQATMNDMETVRGAFNGKIRTVGRSIDSPTGTFDAKYGIDFDASRVSEVYGRSESEVRPKNIAFLYCRKAD